MKLKKLIVTLLVSLTICTATTSIAVPPILTEAHGGRTDSNGGHKDKNNVSGLGSYHYHHGYPAHLHPDGICPYANSTASASSGSATTSSGSNTRSAVTNTGGKTDVQTTVPQSSNTNKTNQSIKISDTSYDNVAFNASFYANNNKDVYDIYGDDAKGLYDHFISSGITEGRQSSEQFSILVYKEKNTDLEDAFGDDLIKYYNHFIESGYNENRVKK